MSAQEVIEQIESLPPAEKARVVEYVHALASVGEGSAESRRVARAALETSAAQIFDRYDELFRKLAR